MGFVDLRDDVLPRDAKDRDRDCVTLLAHPAVVVTIFVLGMIVVFWGLILVHRYLSGQDSRAKFLGWIWWQTNLMFVMITVLAFGLPFRLRFTTNLYGILFVTLILTYAALMISFPPINPPPDDEPLKEKEGEGKEEQDVEQDWDMVLY
jgi:hypothetical protein